MSEETNAVEKPVEEQLEPGIVEFTTAASSKDGARSIVLRKDIGATLSDATEKFGAEAVYSLYSRQGVVAVQAFVRRLLNAETPMTDEQIVTAVEEWKPGTKTPKAAADKIGKAVAEITKLSPEKRAEFLEKLKAELGL